MPIYPRAFFDLQLRFARRMAALAGIPLEQALLDYTNFHVRFGLGRDFDAGASGWREYLSGLRAERDVGDWTYRFYLREPEVHTAPELVHAEGCFAYGFQADVLRIHFRNREPEDVSPLAAPRVGARRAELQRLFAHARAGLGDRELPVVGVSWLYNLGAYRRLFPPAYVRSARVVPGGFRSMPLWGQFLDRHLALRPGPTGAFLRALDALGDPAQAQACFPLTALTVRAPIATFYEHLL